MCIRDSLYPPKADRQTGEGATRYRYNFMRHLEDIIYSDGSHEKTVVDWEGTVLKRIHPNAYDSEKDDGAGEEMCIRDRSCKSRLFTEALKQYVPGKRIQNTKHESDGTELKMCCLEGALAYFLNCKRGYMKVNQRYQVGTLSLIHI